MTKTVDKPVIDPFEAALGVSDVKGRSPWEDAWDRLLKNRAAVYSAYIMIIMFLMIIFGPMLISWESDFTDWDHTSTRPSIESGHWFGTDSVGRDILVRTLEGGRISLLIGLVATIVSIVIGVGYGAIAGYFGVSLKIRAGWTTPGPGLTMSPSRTDGVGGAAVGSGNHRGRFCL